jgi:hypothetical protein
MRKVRQQILLEFLLQFWGAFPPLKLVQLLQKDSNWDMATSKLPESTYEPVPK